jgi:hypothetical protein
MERQPPDRSEPPEFVTSLADRLPECDDDADDIADFYAAQEVSFACLRARYEARLRGKLKASGIQS